MLKGIFLHITSFIIAAALAIYLSFPVTGYPAVHGIFGPVIIIYAVCLVISPWLSIYLSFGGRLRQALFYTVFVPLVSGALLLLIPVLDVLTSAPALWATLLPAVGLGAFMLRREPPQSIETLKSSFERGLKPSYITKHILYKSSLSLFFKLSGKLLFFIATAFTAADMLSGREALPPSFFGEMAVFILVCDFFGYIIYKCMNRR